MPSHLIQKLEHFTRLSADDKDALQRLGARQKTIEAHKDIISEGDKPTHVNLILTGWACRYKQLEDGRRQIISFFLPGDLCDAHVFVLREMDHSVGTITPVTYAEIRYDQFTELTAERPRITQALWWETLVNAAIQREWTVNLGQRDAAERIGHLFCELFIRMRAVGLTNDNTCPLPLSQIQIGEAVGTSAVHVNRSIQLLRQAGLIELRSRSLVIPDLAALQRASLFSPNYLHFDRDGGHLDANATEAQNPIVSTG